MSVKIPNDVLSAADESSSLPINSEALIDYACALDGWSPPPNGYEFDGVNDYLQCSNIFNTSESDYSIELFVKWGAGTYLDGRDSNAVGVIVPIDATKKTPRIIHNSVITESNVPLIVGQIYHLVFVQKYGSTGKIYVDGTEVAGYSSQGTINTPINTTTAIKLFRSSYASSGYLAGNLYKIAIHNRALSVDDITKLYNNGRPWESRLPSEYFSEGAGDTQTSGTLEIGKYYRIKTYVSGDDFTNIGATSNATGVEFLATGTTPTTYTNGSTLEALGETFAIRPSSVGIYSAYDESENGNHAAVNGATPITKNDLQRAYKDAITGDTTLTDVIQGGYYSAYFVFTNTTANAVTINVGTTAGGNDIISSLPIGANETELANAGLYTETTDTYYISSADWNSSSLNMKMMSKKL